MFFSRYPLTFHQSLLCITLSWQISSGDVLQCCTLIINGAVRRISISCQTASRFQRFAQHTIFEYRREYPPCVQQDLVQLPKTAHYVRQQNKTLAGHDGVTRNLSVSPGTVIFARRTDIAPLSRPRDKGAVTGRENEMRRTCSAGHG